MIVTREIYRNPAIGLGAFTLVFALSGQLQIITGDCLVNIMGLAQNIPTMNEYFSPDKLEREQLNEDYASAKNGDISFLNVDFAYPNSDVDVLKDITVRIKDGEK